MNRKLISLMTALVLLIGMFTPFIPTVSPPQVAQAAAGNWCVAGEFNGWNNSNTPIYDDGSNGDLFAGDGIYARNLEITTAGRTQFKVVECGNWGNAYPSDNAWIWLAAPGGVTITFDTNNTSGNAGLPYTPTANIVNIWGDDAPAQNFTVVGPWQGWGNDNPATAMTNLGNGHHILTYTFATAGNYEAKVSATGNWDYQIGADGRNVNAPTKVFNVPADNTVMAFYLNLITGRLAVVPSGAGVGTWCVAGGFNGWSEDGFPLNDSGANGDLIGGDGVFSRDVVIETAGRYEFKINACNWGTSYPGSNAWVITTQPNQVVKFTFDVNDYSGDTGWPFYPTTNIVNAWDNIPDPFVAVGPWQGWNPGNPATALTDLGYNQKALVYAIATAGGSEVKITNNDWANQVGADGRGTNANTVTFTTYADGDPLNLYFDGNSGRLAVFTPASTVLPTDPTLIAPPVAYNVQNHFFYFLLTDRFEDGDPSNNEGAFPGGTLAQTGYLPTDKSFYHGGDFVGLMSKLDYLQGLGVTALWITPPYVNLATQPDSGTAYGIGGAYHGYWILDFENADPHLGTNAELQALIDEAHARGMEVYFDFVVNHTADVIQYAEGTNAYRSKANWPYRDADGNIFDDRDYAGGATFPDLDPAISFPYTPVIPDGMEDAKNPDWLNNPIYYHNRGNSTFAGESSLYGDFFGLDDTFTEHPDVVNGFIAIAQYLIDTFNIDGFRVDTVKHVNTEFWQQFVPAVMDYAQNNGKPDFYMFGEVFEFEPSVLSYYTTAAAMPGLVDFGLWGAARNLASQSGATNNLRDFFAKDDYYIDADSNAYGLGNFISNHDGGLERLGYHLRNENPSAPDAQLVARSTLAHGLMSFARGFPIVYYGDEQGFVGGGSDKNAREDMFPSQVAEFFGNNLIGTDATVADDNFDETHPLYLAIADMAGVRAANAALRTGAQLHRFSKGSAGTYAFSRVDRTERVEYLVALNNSIAADAAAIPTGSPNTIFDLIYSSTTMGSDLLISDGSGTLNVNSPALAVSIWKARVPMPCGAEAPAVSISVPGALTGRPEIAATLSQSGYAEVTFAVSTDGGQNYTIIGTDDNAPYRIFYDVSGYAPDTQLVFQAVVNDLCGNTPLAAAAAGTVVDDSEIETQYVIFNYYRPDGDYGDFSSGDFNDFWGMHVWGNAIHPDDLNPAWDDPVRFSGVDACGAYVALRVVDPTQPVNYIIHRGNDKDVPADQSLNVLTTGYEVWIYSGDETQYTSKAEGCGRVNFHYQRADGDYGDFGSANFNDFWGLHLWQNGLWGTDWANPYRATGDTDFGKLYSVTPAGLEALLGAPVAVDYNEPLNFIMHKGNDKDGGSQNDRSVDISGRYADFWLYDDDATVYKQLGAALNVATIHYHRCAGDYGDPTSANYNDFWGLHTWAGAADPGWTTPRRPDGQDGFGITFDVPLFEDAVELNYILHRGDEKDVPADQTLDLATTGYEIWIVQNNNGVQHVHPAIAHNVIKQVCGADGDLSKERAYWLSEDTIGWQAQADISGAEVRLHYAYDGGMTLGESGISGGDYIVLEAAAPIGGDIAAKFPHLTGIPGFAIPAADLALVPAILKGQIAIAAYRGGELLDATGLQIPGVLDDLYTYAGPLGVTYSSRTPSLYLWAPTAQNVTLHVFPDAAPATPSTTYPMTLDPSSGVWSVAGDPSWNGQYYLYEVEVYVHSTGQVEHNMVTDPYAVSLSMNSTRSQIVDLNDPALAPAGWDTLAKPPLVAPEDIVVYELHVRDFSVNDASVPEALRGTFKAFTLNGTNGVQHLQALADAGLSHLHLLPVFDIATINEDKSQWQEPDWATLASYPPDSPMQQQLIAATADQDGFNWGYDPLHYNVPEGSYSTNPTGVTRIVEFREMVQALNEMGLRVVVDVVYNHTNASGQSSKSVLDRIVPGYYHRLNANGQVENSTCCANTATEHNMMERLMVDSVVLWATQYKVDAFRFDLMGHHMKSNMLNVRAALDALTLADDGVNGAEIYVYGEGWNFGEVANNARGVNATQLNMAGTGIGTFSDRLRDAVRGGGPFDGGNDLIRRQGFISGLYYDPNALNTGSQAEKDTLLLNADQIRVGLAGNLAAYTFVDRYGNLVTGAQVDYNGSPCGYTQDPQEHIVYISKHDNQTLYDINQYKMPEDATMEERVRAQNVGLSIVTLSQGVPFLHAGSDMLRSKSMDRDSYNSGDWFNKLDFTYQDNNWGVGLPVAEKNQENWPLIAPRLANPALKPAPADILSNVHHLQEMLAIRQSSPFFRLQTAAQVQEHLAFHNTGPDQIPGLIVMSLSDPLRQVDPNYARIVVLFNPTDEPVVFGEVSLIHAGLTLHPLQQASYDPVVRTATFDPDTGVFTIPARTTAVFVQEHFSYTVIEPVDDLGPVSFEPLPVVIDVVDRGPNNCLNSLMVTQFEQDHPFATEAHLQTGRHWAITQEGCEPGAPFTVTLSVPLGTVPTDPLNKLCRWANPDWDCGEEADTTVGAESITRTNIHELSLWTVAYRSTPTALTLGSLVAHSGATLPALALLSGVLVLAPVSFVFVRKRRR